MLVLKEHRERSVTAWIWLFTGTEALKGLASLRLQTNLRGICVSYDIYFHLLTDIHEQLSCSYDPNLHSRLLVATKTI